ncbi:MAG: hypothetical protein NTZ90_15645 [Proteobacteria bacterium]|nr:hypothetical protein [Pseudomonadota bacterium]
MSQSHSAAFVAFYKRLFAVPLFWKIWLVCLAVLNLLSAYLLIGDSRGVIILVALTTGAVLGPELYRHFGYTRILGLMHLPWIPMTYLLWAGPIPTTVVAATVIQATVVLNVLCLGIDTIEVIRYVLGNRAEVGTPPQA